MEICINSMLLWTFRPPECRYSHFFDMGLSSGKTQKNQALVSAKRRQPTESHIQSKKPNLEECAVTPADVSKEFGINSKEITLTRVGPNMSPKLHGDVSRAGRKSDSEDTKCLSPVACDTDIISSKCKNFNEISITKVSSKESPARDRKRSTDAEGVKMFSSDDSETNLKDEGYANLDSDFQRDSQSSLDFQSSFWHKDSVSSSRMSKASNFLYSEEKSSVNSYTNSGYGIVVSTPGLIPETDNWDEEAKAPSYSYLEPARNEENWDTYDVSANNQVIIQDHSNYSPDSAYGSMGDSEMSPFLLGFPNPPGENRCWLNATLQTLFATLFSLPIAEDMQQLLQFNKCSKITQMLGDLHELWKKGSSEKTRIYNTVKKFKESLSTVERTYCSDRQQDVSEFLMALLNHLKTEFGKSLSKDSKTMESEKTSLNSCESSSSTSNESAELNQASNSNDAKESEDEKNKNSNVENSGVESKKQTIENPIDKYFQQKMVENYVCRRCEKHRQILIENLMIYADIPPENDVNSVDLTEAIQKTFAEEERNLICEHCKNDTHKMKTFYKEYPKILTIQINRYGMSNDGMMNKICTPVSIPEKLSLSNFVLEQSDVTKIYEPICIISHVGSNMDCGHYTSYVKHDDQWFHYNDMSVMPLTPKDVLSAAQSTAYLIFYVDSDLLDKPASDCYSSRCSPIH